MKQFGSFRGGQTRDWQHIRTDRRFGGRRRLGTAIMGAYGNIGAGDTLLSFSTERAEPFFEEFSFLSRRRALSTLQSLND
ncbi:uncharacterized protein SPSK_10939 [Sporothrix schenckii 1099-18]|uniref:Uncharacterized protein n=1 Tax=Sporothrix schenckii 1099-18 TaxID=1397361 RepID=A0A0F2M9F2_SPOSC|nr:uncharacterized protein SPSK_10939 [Sporothrix schenckii 1099-18]KJR85714.1 hypothetical protein SPSK_10939 [Sporothrix schenckii 1099-18]